MRASYLVVALLCLGMSGCESTAVATRTVDHVPDLVKETSQQSLETRHLAVKPGTFLLKQIMADPDWIGRPPENARWHSGSQHILFEQKREGSVIRDVFSIDPDTGNTLALTLNEQPYWDQSQRVFNKDHSAVAWVYDNNVFVQTSDSGQVRQLTSDTFQPQDLMFLNDNRVAFRIDNGFFAVSLSSGLKQQLLSWHFATAPRANVPAEDFIAREQQSLLQFTQVQRSKRKQRFEHNVSQRIRHGFSVPEPYYFAKDHTLVEASLSPSGHHAVIVTRKDLPNRKTTDIMPNYIHEDGRVHTVEVRRRVADAKPVHHEVWLVDMRGGLKRRLDYQVLPGFNEDVLADVKAENAAARGESYEPNRLPRSIGLVTDWYWQQSAIQWHGSGNALAIMLEAWDNKDRWLATVNLAEARLIPQHRLHDDAWINYKFNRFGWFHQSQQLYFLSEQTGFAHLYSVIPGQAPVQLTKGKFEVDDLTLTRNDKSFYFKANRVHPGIYEIYRLDIASGDIVQLTQLGGMTDYLLSPDEQRLLLVHSALTRPPELWEMAANTGESPTKLTNTVSETFNDLPWQAPQIITVDNGKTEAPVYARLYLPDGWQNQQALRAVVFNHGAGYRQNAHYGWSSYFREFMFHNLLAQEGYVVLDMDFRASAGYGRDWRTAIYRQIGTPELEDLEAGVNWLVDNANVGRDRIGTYGGSYGGFLTFMALFTKPDLFASGAALRPVSDWAHYNTAYTSNILNTPDVDPIAYRRSSPIYHAEGLQKPLLINAPMVDSNVFFVDVVRLVQRLIELEKQDFETAIYPVESHGFVQPSSWLDEYRRIFKLFEETL